jgi:hypothetical protein
VATALEAAEEARREVARLRAQVEQQKAEDTECANVAEIIRNTQGATAPPKQLGVDLYAKHDLISDRHLAVVETATVTEPATATTEMQAPSPIPPTASGIPSSSGAWLPTPLVGTAERAGLSTPAPSRPAGTPYSAGVFATAALTPSNRIHLSEAVNGDRLLMAAPLLEDHGRVRRQNQAGQDGAMGIRRQDSGAADKRLPRDARWGVPTRSPWRTR